MNLAYDLNDKTEINGKTYELDMSFDNILRLFDLLRDKTIDDVTKVETGLLMLINDKLEQYEDEQKAIIFLELFNSVIGATEKEKIKTDIAGNPMPTMSNDDENTHDLVQDAEFIYASFMHTYQIDLFEQQGKLHWHKFKALLNGLGEDTIFSRIVDIRTRELPKGKGTQKERERLKKLKEQYKIT